MRRLPFLGVAAVAITVVTAACGSQHGDRPLVQPALFSPNGEPLSGGELGHPDCATALSAWFARLAGEQGGTINRQQFLADANAQFDRMDLNHDGFITPAELTEFREDSAEPVVDTPPPPEASQPNQTNQQGGRHRRQGGDWGAASTGGGSRSTASLPADTVDPVMSADKSLSFKVSRADFMAQAEEIFAQLDRDHDGRLERDEVVATCPKKK